MEFEFITNPYFISGMAVFVIGVFGYISYKYPYLVKKLKIEVDVAELFLEMHKNDVPAEYKGIVEDAHKMLEDFKAALVDDKITYKEVFMLGMDFLAVIDEMKDIIASMKK